AMLMVILAGCVAIDMVMQRGGELSTTALLVAIYSAVALVGFARGFYGPAYSALRASVIAPELFANASAWSSAAWQAGAVLGPLIGGFLFAKIGVGGTLTTVVAMVALSLVMVTFVRPPPPAPSRPKEPILVAIREGLRFVFSNKPLLYSISLDLVAVLFGGV